MNGPPTTLGQYQIIREIARSNDVVYEAYDPLMNRRVAVKELAVPHGSTQQQREERVSRFKREAQAAGTLNHPNIMTVFSFAEEAGRIFMAMEYLDGVTLRNEIDTKGFVPAERATEIAADILEGLGHAHSKGVIHRDIKPDNIQLLTNGTTKITDFGIARLTFQPNLTMDGQVFGTPSYMSPEQVVGKEIDARSDLFSVGVLLYEMVGGQKPFAGDSVVSITYAIMNTEPTKPQQCGEALWQVIRKALDKSPMMRFGSAAEMATALKEAHRQDSDPGMNQIFALGNQTINTPYQPQPTQQPVYSYNPYTNQTMQAPIAQAPPIQTPYQPQGYPQPQYVQPYQQYQQQQYNTGMYMPQGSMPPPNFPPVYYPPPPRQALMKPETADFLKRLTIALIIMGTVFGVILTAVKVASEVFQNNQAARADATVQPLVDPKLPIDEQISQLEQQKSQVTTPSKVEEFNKQIAALMLQQGQKAAERGSTAEAEKHFRDALEKDQSNPALYSHLAKLYETQASVASNPELWHEAAQNWRSAWSLETDTTRKAAYGEGAAISSFNYASTILSSQSLGAERAARQALYDARETAPPGSQVSRQVEELLGQLG